MFRLSLVLSLVLVMLASLEAQEKSRAKEKAKEKDVVISPEREAAVNAFVAEQHPELAELLKPLKENSPRQYERAMRELFIASEHLAQLKASDPQRYALELKVWKLHSRAQLLSAKMMMISSDELKQELQSLLGEQYDARRELLAYDRDKLRDRMKKLDKDLADHEARRETVIKKQFDALTSHTVVKGKVEKKKEPEKNPLLKPGLEKKSPSEESK